METPVNYVLSSAFLVRWLEIGFKRKPKDDNETFNKIKISEFRNLSFIEVEECFAALGDADSLAKTTNIPIIVLEYFRNKLIEMNLCVPDAVYLAGILPEDELAEPLYLILQYFIKKGVITMADIKNSFKEIALITDLHEREVLNFINKLSDDLRNNHEDILSPTGPKIARDYNLN